MAGPWEQYANQSVGPWTQYAPVPASSATGDFFKSIPRGVVSGFLNALANTGQAASVDMVTPEGRPMAETMPTAAQGLQQIEKTIGPMHQPEGRAGRVGAAIGEGLGNPVSYVGPGSLPLKIGGAILSSAGGELGGQAAEGTPYEGAARVAGGIAGGIAGGMAAAKTLGPGVPKAVTPTLEELKQSAASGYNAARNSGLELSPKGVGNFAASVQQELTGGPKYGFTGGNYGTAPKTLALLDALQSAPAGAKITAPNLDTLRIAIGNIAKDTKDFRPTPDAKAAMVLKDRLAKYLENIPQGDVVAGDAASYVGAIRQANGDFAAAARLGKVTDKLRNAENNAQGGIATSIENQQKGQLRNIFLNNPKQTRGFSADEVEQMQRVNDGSFTGNVLRQLGRAGTGVIPLTMQAAASVPLAIGTGGASVFPQLALATALYGAKKGSEALTNSQVKKLVEMLAQRSPLYQQRLNNLPAAGMSQNIASIVRGGLLGGLAQ